MRIIKKILLLIILCIMPIVYITGCGDITNSGIGNNNINPPIINDGELKEFKNVYLEDKVVDYDGNYHTLEVTGDIPSGTNISYSKNSYINHGIHEVIAIINCDGYKELILKAYLTIKTPELKVQFLDMTCTYDGTQKFIGLIGELPEGVTCYYSNNYRVNAGVYEVTANFYSNNPAYKEEDLKPLTATLTINKAQVSVEHLKFENKSFEFDAYEKELLVSGNIPDSVLVTYENNKLTNPGEVTATANFSLKEPENYEPLTTTTLTAKLSITYDNPDLSYEINNDTVTITKYSGSSKTLFIPGIIEGKPVTKIADNAFATKNDTLRLIYIPQTVETLNATVMFSKCSKLKNICTDGLGVPENWINAGNTKCDFNNNIVFSDDGLVYHFADNSYEESLLVLDYIGDSKELLIPTTYNDIYVSGFFRIAFHYCEQLEKITLPGAKYIDDIELEYCPNLKELTVSEGTKKFYDVLKNSSSIEKVNLPESLEVIYGSFEGCYNLREVNMKNNVKVIEENSFYNCAKLQSLTLSNKLERIGKSAFEGCESLEHIDIPSSVNIIESSAFFDCEKLKTVNINGNITRIEKYTFSRCINLTTVSLPNTLKEIDASAFKNCSSLNKIVLPEGLTKINDNVFYNCQNLKDVNIPKTVTYLGNDAFYGCENIDSFILSSSVTTCYDFADSRYIKYILIEHESKPSDWLLDETKYNIIWDVKDTDIKVENEIKFVTNDKTKKSIVIDYVGDTGIMNIPSSISECTVVEIIGRALINNLIIQNITVPITVNKIGSEAFDGCNNLKYILFEHKEQPQGWGEIYSEPIIHYDYKNKVEQIGDYLIYKNDELKQCEIIDYTGTEQTVNVPSMIADYEVISISNAFKKNDRIINLSLPETITSMLKKPFSECYNLFKIELPSCLSKIVGNINGEVGSAAYGFDTCTNLTEVVLGDGITEIGDYAFAGAKKLSIINIHNAVTSIGRYAFSDCHSLNNLVLTNNITNIGLNAFFNCDTFTKMMIPGSVRVIKGEYIVYGHKVIDSYGFSTCDKLTEVIIGEGVVELGVAAFSYCSNIVNLVVPNSVVTIGDYAFLECNNVGHINIPSGVNSIGKHAFNSCYNIKSIVIPYGITKLEYATFNDCRSLVSAKLPTSLTIVDGFCFNGCVNLSDIDISWLKSIGEQAFYKCAKITKADFTHGFYNLGDYAFAECTSLSSVYIPRTIVLVGAAVFKNCTNLREIYCELFGEIFTFDSHWLDGCNAKVTWGGMFPM